jgi:hypothetical protein
MVSARARVAGYWDEHVAGWLAGSDPMESPMPAWFASYRGRGDGAVTRDGFPEPYAGDLLGLERTPRVVVLGLNPGRFYPQFQSPDGLFATEIRQHGSYSKWMTTGPYYRAPWTTVVGPNRYYLARLSFTRRWLNDPLATYQDLVIFEAFPWHSTSVTAPMQLPPHVIDEFVWQPIAELPARDVFAFGRPWQRLATTLGLPLLRSLGAGGQPYGSAVASRAVRLYALPSGQRLVVEWHSGSATPPNLSEIEHLRNAIQ